MIDATNKGVLRRAAYWMVPAYLLVPLTFLIHIVDPFTSPNFDLTGGVALVAYAFAISGGPSGVPVIAGLMIGLLVSRAGLRWKRRLVEAGVLVAVAGVMLGGGAALNEYVIKPALGVPRPDIIELAGTPDHSALGMTAEEFYERMPRSSDRGAYLRSISRPDGFEGVALHPLIRDHWIDETGFSRPSGHALTSMLFATFFLAMALALLSGWRQRVCYLVVPWAVAVCYSRPILRVHSPTDISIGGFEGLVLGVAAFLLVRRLLRHRWGAT